MILRQIILGLLITFGVYESALGATDSQDTLVVNQRELRSCKDTSYLKLMRSIPSPYRLQSLEVAPVGGSISTAQPFQKA